MCGNRRADLRQRQGWRSLNDAFWSAVPISARIISKQAWVEEKMETEASFLVNQTRSFCVRSPMSRLLKALIAETEAQETLITGPLAGHSRASGCQRSRRTQGPDSRPGAGGSGVGLPLSQLVCNLPWFSVWLPCASEGRLEGLPILHDRGRGNFLSRISK